MAIMASILSMSDASSGVVAATPALFTSIVMVSSHRKVSQQATRDAPEIGIDDVTKDED